MPYLGDCISELYNLKHLELYLYKNSLGDYEDKFEYFLNCL